MLKIMKLETYAKRFIANPKCNEKVLMAKFFPRTVLREVFLEGARVGSRVMRQRINRKVVVGYKCGDKNLHAIVKNIYSA